MNTITRDELEAYKAELRQLSLPDLEARSVAVQQAVFALGMHDPLFNTLKARQQAINEERFRRLSPDKAAL